MIDTHAHITCMQLLEDVEGIMIRAKEAGIERILNICLSLEEAKIAFDIQKQYPCIDIAIGYHPSDIKQITKEDWDALHTIIKDERILAIGEIGLDYHWEDVPHDVQKEAFIKQLKWANEVQKPVLIHMRDATQDTLSILKEYKQVPGVMHCFSGSLETAQIAIGLNMYISVGGPLTFKNARGIPEVMKHLPIDRIFIETDCPYLTPHPFRGKRNEPMYLPYILKTLAEVREISEKELETQLKVNYQTLFAK